MELTDFLRIALLCVLLAGAETFNGVFRIIFLTPKIGKSLANKLSVLTGILLAFGLCYLFVPKIGLIGIREHLFLGLGLSVFMAAFDVVIARFLMHFKWSRIWQDFDLRSGNYLSVGLILLAFLPSLVEFGSI